MTERARLNLAVTGITPGDGLRAGLKINSDVCCHWCLYCDLMARVSLPGYVRVSGTCFITSRPTVTVAITITKILGGESVIRRSDNITIGNLFEGRKPFIVP